MRDPLDIIRALPGIRSLWILGEASTANGVTGGVNDSIGSTNWTSSGMVAADWRNAPGPHNDRGAIEALYFDGVDATLSAGSNTELAFTASSTWCGSMWVKIDPTVTTASIAIISKTDSASPFRGWEIGFEYNASLSYRPYVYLSSTWSSVVTYPHFQIPGGAGQIGVKRGVWVQLAWQITPPASGTITASHFTFWLDGVRCQLRTATFQTLTTTSTITNSITARIGSRNAAQFFFKGWMSTGFVADGAVLTDDIVRELHLASVGRLRESTDTVWLLDTDCDPDSDSYATEIGLPVILHSQGRINLLGIGLVNGAGTQDGVAVGALLDHYGVTDVTIAKNAAANLAGLIVNFADDVATAFPSTYPVGSYIPTMRALLGAAANNSVVMLSGGPLTTLRQLLNSTDTGDGFGTGSALIKAKVKRIYIASGGYTDSGSGYSHMSWPVTPPIGGSPNIEWNLQQDAAAADDVAQNWPSEIVWVGTFGGYYSSVGGTRITPTGPIATARTGSGTTDGRNTWGTDLVLAAFYLEGGEDARMKGKLFEQGPTGTNRVNTATNTPYAGFAAGYNRFTHGATRTVSGTVYADRYVTNIRNLAAVAELLLSGGDMPRAFLDPDDVRLNVDNGGGSPGTITFPATTGNVDGGVGYGANGTEFTGTGMTLATLQTELDARNATAARLLNLDATVSSRLATTAYVAPLDAAGTRAALGLGASNLDVQLAAIAAGIAGLPGETTGDGDVAVDHNYGGADALKIVADDGTTPVDGAKIQAYVKADYDAGTIDPRPPTTYSGSNGRWTAPLNLDPDTYWINVYNPITKRVDQFELEVT